MKKYARIYVVSVCLLAILLSLSGCKSVNTRKGFFNKRTLRACALENIPKPDFTYTYHDDIYRRIEGIIEEENFYAYAQEVFEYLDGKFAYLGTYGEVVEEATMFSDADYAYRACERTPESYRNEHRDSDGELLSIGYYFVYFKDPPSKENDWSTTYDLSISYSFSPITVKTKDGGQYTTNFRMKLRKAGVSNRFVDYETLLTDSYERQRPECGQASVLHDYGRDESYNAWIAMLQADGETYSDAAWTETVGDYVFHYPNGNRILVAALDDNDAYRFYTLTQAYDERLLYSQDLKRIEQTHRELYPELYSATESLQ